MWGQSIGRWSNIFGFVQPPSPLRRTVSCSGGVEVSIVSIADNRCTSARRKRSGVANYVKCCRYGFETHLACQQPDATLRALLFCWPSRININFFEHDGCRGLAQKI
jgi:hypothetical protein